MIAKIKGLKMKVEEKAKELKRDLTQKLRKVAHKVDNNRNIGIIIIGVAMFIIRYGFTKIINKRNEVWFKNRNNYNEYIDGYKLKRGTNLSPKIQKQYQRLKNHGVKTKEALLKLNILDEEWYNNRYY